jgi:hypothetical protein
MYIHEAEPLSEPRYGGFSAAAVAVPVAGGITLAMVLEAIAFVVSAIAAAYLLIRAYEEAEKRGIGLGLAAQVLSAGLGKLLAGARSIVALITSLLSRARRITNPDPNCRNAIEELVRAGGELNRSILELETELRYPTPRIHILRPIMNRIGTQANRCGAAFGAAMRHCGPQLPGI